MNGIPCENNHKHGESMCKIGFNGKYLCQSCANEIGDFDQHGPLSKPSKERDASRAQMAEHAKIAEQSPAQAGPTVTLPKEKKCSICGQTLPLENFENDKRRPDGHGPRCKECVKKRAAERKAGSA